MPPLMSSHHVVRLLSRSLHPFGSPRSAAAARPLSCLVRSPQSQGGTSMYNNDNILQSQSTDMMQQQQQMYQQRRSMVVVTKTQAATVPKEDDEAMNAPSTTNTNAPASPSVDAERSGEESLIITDACWKQILRLAARKETDPREMLLRVYVDAGGCSGFEYKFEVETAGDEALEEDDVVLNGPQGARVVVDETSLGFIRGATLDYVTEMIKSAFTVRDNPLSESACGCGSSFAVKNFTANPALD